MAWLSTRTSDASETRRVPCEAMPVINSAAITEVVNEHWRRALRYCAVSAVNVTVGLGTLAFALEVLDFAPVVANLTAWMISTVPAYLLSRYWVWQQLGANSVSSEILPFWIIALVGLLLSSATIAVLGSITDNTPILLLGTLAAFGTVWVVKYLVLDGLLWPKRNEEAERDAGSWRDEEPPSKEPERAEEAVAEVA